MTNIEMKYEEAGRKTRKVFRVSKLCLAIAILTPVLVATSKWHPSSEALAVFFQRSGSLMVLFAAASEYFLLTVHNDVHPSGRTTSYDTEFVKRYAKQHNILSMISLVSAAIGTLIWGYGDLLYGI